VAVGGPAPFSRRAFLRSGVAVAGVAAVGPRLLATSLGPTAPVASSTLVPAPPIVTRAQWGADEALGDRSRGFAPIQKAVVHHTAIPVGDPAAHMRAMLREHTQVNGWSDLGYQFCVAPDGTIYEGRWARDYLPGETHDGEDGRGGLVIGAHALEHNTGALGIAVMGDYTGATVTDAAMASVARLVAWKFAPRDLDPHGATPYTKVSDGAVEVFPNICGHRDVFATGCPGNGFYPRLPELRDRVTELYQKGLVGFRLLGADGSLWGYGTTRSFGTAADIGDVRRTVGKGIPVRTAIGTPSGNGAIVSDVNGGIYALGDARFLGSLGNTRLNRPIVGMAATAATDGYWLVASDGGIFSFGSATFHGSTGAVRLNQPIVGMASTPADSGYWLVASDGGIFSFGDAGFFGSTGAVRLNQPITSMAATSTGSGYWLLARDGGIFCFGDAAFLGSAVGRIRGASTATDIQVTPTGRGYWVLDSTGAVHGFGDAPVFGAGVTAGSMPALALVPVVRP
jgi:hypothetical protein